MDAHEYSSPALRRRGRRIPVVVEGTDHFAGTANGVGTTNGAGTTNGRAGHVVNGTYAPDRVAPSSPADALARLADEARLARVQMVAWRDLEDPEAGGSEFHAHRVAARWADAGIEIELRTSAVDGRSRFVRRSGYQVVRQPGRYGVFPHVAWHGLRTETRPGEGLVEIWNGMPFFSPLWFRGPRIVFLHHVHAEMWGMALPRWLARTGDTIERRVAPPLYRNSRIVTLSESSRGEIVSMSACAPRGSRSRRRESDRGFTPDGDRSAVPLVVAVGRLVPVKRFDMLIEALARVRVHRPDLRAVIVGEGYERPSP